MRINQPVTGVEHEIKDGEFVLSKTDLKGVITSVNTTFIEISGYAEHELIGQPHNLLRHPEMPAEAYEDMWKQLQAGRSWMGAVKNRCKNGDYYWAMANVSPIWENGQVTGYMSLRRRPERHEIDAVTGIYEKFRGGKAGNLAFDNGKIVKRGRWNEFKRAVAEISIKKRIVLLAAMMGGFMLLLSAVAIQGLMKSNAMIDEVYAKALRPAELAEEIRNRLNANRSEVLLGMQHSPDHPLAQLHDHKVGKHVDAMSENSARVTKAWEELSRIEFDSGMASTAQVGAALEAFKQARIKFGNDGILPAKSALQAEMYGDVGDMLIDSIEPNYKLLQESTNSLTAALKEYASEVRQAAVNQFNFILYFSIAAAFVAIGMGAFFSWLSIRAIIGPVERIAGQMREIRQGRLDKLIDIERQDEIGEMAEVFRSLLIRLGFDLEDSRMQAIQSARINMALKEVASAVTVADEKANIIFVNDAAESLLSQISDRKPVKGSQFYELIGNKEMLDGIRQSDNSRTTADGLMKNRFVRINRSKVFDDENIFVGYVTQWVDRTEEVEAEKRAEEAFRMSFALRNVETAVTVSDESCKLIFVNGVGGKLLQTLTGDPDAANRLIGQPVSDIVDDDTLKSLLTRPLAHAESAEGKLNGRIIRIYSAPIHNAEGKLIGRLSQWQDRTAEVAAEREIAQLVESVARGDFSKRMSEADKEGFFQVIAKGLNQLSEVSEKGLTEVAGVLNALSNGDLTQRIESDYEGMFAQLKDDANRTVDQLRDIVGTITEATDTIHTAAREISSGNADLANRTESQSASLEETAASTEELNSTVRNNDDNAHQANDLARSASEVAARGGEVVQEVVQTMGAITESSTKISEIIGVIDGIAFQTNILALNAAVEAARAGEQGRGFAVVAGEVRSLAQRSAAAAKEIKELISESVTKVTAGHKLVEHAGETMNEVVGSIQRVSHIMNEITVSSAEQRNGIEQLNLAITSMDEATQQNVALVEEAAAAAQAMEDQAGNLKQAVSIFKVEAESSWDGRERRGPDRAANVQRMSGAKPAQAAIPKSAPSKAAMQKAAMQKASGGEDTWEEF